jgi:hypothetical protein
MATWWVSCNRFTIRVETRDGTIVEAAPICRKFIGQPLRNLLAWAGHIGGLRFEKLEVKDE